MGDPVLSFCRFSPVSAEVPGTSAKAPSNGPGSIFLSAFFCRGWLRHSSTPGMGRAGLLTFNVNASMLRERHPAVPGMASVDCAGAVEACWMQGVEQPALHGQGHPTPAGMLGQGAFGIGPCLSPRMALQAGQQSCEAQGCMACVRQAPLCDGTAVSCQLPLHACVGASAVEPARRHTEARDWAPRVPATQQRAAWIWRTLWQARPGLQGVRGPPCVHCRLALAER